MMIKKVASVVLSGSLLLTGVTVPVSAFDPMEFDKAAYEQYKDEKGKVCSFPQFAEAELKKEVIRIAGDIRDDKFSLPDSDDNRKITAFIKSIPYEEWENYPVINQVAISILLQYAFPDNARLSLSEFEECVSSVRDSMCTLINNDPNFSDYFKAYMNLKVYDLGMYVPGVSEPLVKISGMSLDDLALGSDGSLKNLNSYKKENYCWDPDLDKRFENYVILGYSQYLPNATMMSDIDSPFVMVEACNLLSVDSKSKEQLKVGLMTALGHEITHFVMSHFEEHFLSSVGNKNCGVIPPGEKDSYHRACDILGISKTGENYDHVRLCAYRDILEFNLGDYSMWLDVPTESDKEYISELYKTFVNYVSRIDTRLTYPQGETFKKHGVEGLPVILAGDGYFAESIADIVGLKAAVISARSMGISAETVYQSGFQAIWEPQNISNALEDVYIMSPYRIDIAYKFSLISPDTFGFISE